METPIFMTAAGKLLEFPDTGTEENLRAFYDEALRVIGRVERVKFPRKGWEKLPAWDRINFGFTAWCKFRAQIVVRWGCYFDRVWTDGSDPSIFFTMPRATY